MARRVLRDLEKSSLSMSELAQAYKVDVQFAGAEYFDLIQLGRLLDELSHMATEAEYLY